MDREARMPKPFDLHPEMRLLTEAAAAQPPASGIAEMRANWARYTAVTNRPPPPDMETHDRTIPATAMAVPVRVYRPAGVGDRAPTLLYFHGGGFMKGDLDSSETVAWGFAEKIGAVVVSVDYRLAPEHPYPAAFEDCRAVLAYVAAHPDEFGADPERIALAGDSAGGNLAAAVSLAARDRGGPAVAAQALIYPVLGCDLTLPSYVANAEAPGLTTASMEFYWKLYVGGEGRTEDPYAAPLAARDFAGLPPTMIHTAEHDPLLDDGVAFAERLRAVGVPVEYRCARRMIHGFLRARLHGPDAAAEYDAICAFLRRYLTEG